MNTYALSTDVAEIGGLRQRGLIIAAVGFVAGAVGVVLQPSQLWSSWLIGFMFCLGMSMGALALLMIQHMTGGQWGMATRRILEAGARVLPFCVLLFIPLAFVLPKLYVWANPANVAADEVLRHRAFYFKIPFFLTRAAIYFFVWWGCSYYLNRWSVQQDQGIVGVTEADTRRFRVVSAPGLLLYVVLMSLGCIDWLMSLDAHWYSTIFGFIMVAGQGLGAMSFAVIVLARLARREPMQGFLRAVHFHDLGKLMLMFVMLWAYFSFSQFLIIWAGNLPDEIPFYLARMRHGWQYISLAIIFGHFALPFCLLLSRDLKRHPNLLARVAWFIIAMRLVDLIWLVAPAFNQDGGSPVSLANVGVPVCLFGVWMCLFASQLGNRPLLPANDPYFKEMLAHGHTGH
jgi:hypothetical protein